MALEAVTPRQPGQRTLPDRTGQQGQRAAASSSSRAGCTQGPRPRLRGPWALIFTVLGVLLLVSSRLESWLQKALLVARKRPGRPWLGKSRQDPPGQVQYAACWWGALEECGSLAILFFPSVDIVPMVFYVPFLNISTYSNSRRRTWHEEWKSRTDFLGPQYQGHRAERVFVPHVNHFSFDL